MIVSERVVALVGWVGCLALGEAMCEAGRFASPSCHRAPDACPGISAMPLASLLTLHLWELFITVVYICVCV